MYTLDDFIYGDLPTPLTRRDIGKLTIASGRVAATDPASEAWCPLTATFPKGDFPATAVMDRNVVAALTVIFSSAPIRQWEAAAIDDRPPPAPGQIPGVAIDSGRFAFVEVDAGPQLEALREESVAVLLPETSTATIDVGPYTMVVTSSGAGDSVYAVWLGLDDSGHPAAMLADFQIVPIRKPEFEADRIAAAVAALHADLTANRKPLGALLPTAIDLGPAAAPLFDDLIERFATEFRTKGKLHFHAGDALTAVAAGAPKARDALIARAKVDPPTRQWIAACHPSTEWLTAIAPSAFEDAASDPTEETLDTLRRLKFVAGLGPWQHLLQQTSDTGHFARVATAFLEALRASSSSTYITNEAATFRNVLQSLFNRGDTALRASVVEVVIDSAQLVALDAIELTAHWRTMIANIDDVHVELPDLSQFRYALEAHPEWSEAVVDALFRRETHRVRRGPEDARTRALSSGP